MTEYRKPKLTFITFDWMAVWFTEVGEWRRFYDRPTSVVVDDSDSVSEELYMEWYADITRMRVGKPQPEP